MIQLEMDLFIAHKLNEKLRKDNEIIYIENENDSMGIKKEDLNFIEKSFSKSCEKCGQHHIWCTCKN
jgi:hypothetical protein